MRKIKKLPDITTAYNQTIPSEPVPPPAFHKIQIYDFVHRFMSVQIDIILDTREYLDNFVEQIKVLLGGTSSESESLIRYLLRNGTAPSVFPPEIIKRLEDDPLHNARFSIDFYRDETFLFSVNSREIDF